MYSRNITHSLTRNIGKRWFRPTVVVLLCLLIATTLSAKAPVASASIPGGEKIYVIGGNNCSSGPETPLATVEIYDPATDTWSVAASMPAPKLRASGVNVGGYIHVLGEDERHFRYDLATDTWQELAPLPVSRTGQPAVGVIDGKIYVAECKITSPSDFENWLYMYDPATDQWIEKEPIPQTHPRFDFAFASLNGKLYAIGGKVPYGEYLTRVDVYDPATNKWHIGGAASQNVLHTIVRGSVPVLNGKIYVAGGAVSSAVSVYDPVLDRWCEERSMNTPALSWVLSRWEERYTPLGDHQQVVRAMY